MEIKICCYTVEEYMKHTGCTTDEVIEWYGEGAVKLYWAETDDMTGSFAGVQYADGHYSFYGCRCDEEYVTFERMLAGLVREFVKE